MRVVLRVFLGLTLLPLAAGCAHLRGDTPPSPDVTLHDGLTAWQQGDYRRAALQLSVVATSSPDTVLADKARLLLAALALDPRNDARDPGQAAAIAGELLTAPRVSAIVGRLGEVLYLLARDQGAPAPPDSGALPHLPGTPLASRLDRLQAEYDRQRLELQRLQQESKSKDEELERLRKELERIRKTLQP